MTVKKCVRCGQSKSGDEFNKDSRHRDGLDSYCKLCHKILVSAYGYRLQTKALNLLGGKCVRCGETDRRVLQINHLNGTGGGEDRYNQRKFLRSLVKGQRSTDNLEVRCANCNILYEYERGVRTYLV